MRDIIDYIDHAENDMLAEGKLSGSQLLRLSSTNRTMSLSDALESGKVEKKREWTIQDNSNHGNLLNYKPDWKSRGSVFASLELAEKRLEKEGNPKGTRILQRTIIVDADNPNTVYGYTEQKVIKSLGEDLLAKPSSLDEVKDRIITILNSNEFDMAHKLSQVKSLINRTNIK